MRRGSIPLGPMISRVRAQTTTYDIDRREGSSAGGYEYAEDAAEAELYLYNPAISQPVRAVGEVDDGSLIGLCLPDEDIEVYDRVSYGQGRYEVKDPIDGLPRQNDPQLLKLQLERVEESSSSDDFTI